MLRRLVLLLGAALALLAPAALAAAPKLGRFTGTSSQHRQVTVRTTTSSQVRWFTINWTAPCGKRFVYTAKATLDHLPIRKGGFFTTRLKYQDKLDGGRHTEVATRLAGRFVSGNKATGTWNGGVKLFQGKRQVSTCRTHTVTWTVRHQRKRS